MDWFRLMIYTLAALVVAGVPWALVAAWRGNWRHCVRITGGLGFASLVCMITPFDYQRGISEDFGALELIFAGAAGALIVLAAACAGALLYWLGRRRRRSSRPL